MNALFCTQCGAKIAEGSLFCSHCGMNLKEGGTIECPEPPRPIRIWFQCPKCGCRFEKSGDELHVPEFGQCVKYGYKEK